MPHIRDIKPASRLSGVYRINDKYLLVVEPRSESAPGAPLTQWVVRIDSEKTSRWRALGALGATLKRNIQDLLQIVTPKKKETL